MDEKILKLLLLTKALEKKAETEKELKEKINHLGNLWWKAQWKLDKLDTPERHAAYELLSRLIGKEKLKKIYHPKKGLKIIDSQALLNFLLKELGIKEKLDWQASEMEKLKKRLEIADTLERNVAAHIMEKVFGKKQLAEWGKQIQMGEISPDILRKTLVENLIGEELENIRRGQSIWKDSAILNALNSQEYQARYLKWKDLAKRLYRETPLDALKRIGTREWKYGGVGGKAKVIGGILGGLGALGGLLHGVNSLFEGGEREIKIPQNKQSGFWDYITNKFSEIF